MILTYKYRLKNWNAKSALRRHAYAVNQYGTTAVRNSAIPSRVTGPEHQSVNGHRIMTCNAFAKAQARCSAFINRRSAACVAPLRKAATS